MQSVLSPVQVNLTKANGLALYQGSAWSIPVSVVSRENGVDTKADLSGYTGSCTIKKRVDDDTAIWTPTVTIDSEDTSKFLVFLSSEQSQNFEMIAESFADTLILYYEVKMRDTVSGEEYRTIYGDLECVPSAQDDDDIEE